MPEPEQPTQPEQPTRRGRGAAPEQRALRGQGADASAPVRSGVEHSSRRQLNAALAASSAPAAPAAPEGPAPVAGAQQSRRGARRSRPQATQHRGFARTLAALDDLASSGAQVSVHVVDLDSDAVVLAGDDGAVHPIAGLGAVPILLAVAAAVDAGTLDLAVTARRDDADPAVTGGLWQRLDDVALHLGDLATLSAAVCDPAATNLLLTRVGRPSVDAVLADLGLQDIAVLDGARDVRGPDDAPATAVGSTRDLARLMSLIANGRAVGPAASAQTGEWLSLNADLTLVGAGTGLDPFDHDDDKHGLLFFNKTGRADGVRTDAGVLAGPRAGVAYALTVCFDDPTIAHRLRVVEAMRGFGTELMEYVY